MNQQIKRRKMPTGSHACTKATLATKIHETIGLSKREASQFVEQFFAVVTKTLAQGQDVKLPSFGTLTAQQRDARLGRNPRTGESHMIPQRRALVFRASPMLKKRIKQATDHE